MHTTSRYIPRSDAILLAFLWYITLIYRLLNAAASLDIIPYHVKATFPHTSQEDSVNWLEKILIQPKKIVLI